MIVKLPLDVQLLATGNRWLMEFVKEHEFDASRKWRLDFAWLNHKSPLGVEVDGATWTGGRHTRGKGYAEDCRKLNAATVAGWRVLRFTTDQVGSGEALRVIAEALGEKLV